MDYSLVIPLKLCRWLYLPPHRWLPARPNSPGVYRIFRRVDGVITELFVPASPASEGYAEAIQAIIETVASLEGLEAEDIYNNTI